MTTEQLESGLTLPEAMADLAVVPTEDMEQDRMEVDGVYEDSADEDDADDADVEMNGVNMDELKSALPPLPVRIGSPDMSWLPPLPVSSDGPSLSSAVQTNHTIAFTSSSSHNDYRSHLMNTGKDDELTGPSSLYAKFVTPLPFAQSQLADSFIDPSAGPPLTKPAWEQPPQQSTLPSLLKAYEALKNEGSVSLAQTPLRMQAGDLLKRVICPPDFDAAPDTLVFPLSGPKMPLGMASYSRPPDAAAGEVSPDAAVGGKGVLPEPRIPINPQPDGVLARLVREMRSQYLPPSFRDRMLHITPPPALIARDGNPLLYGDPVRGPDRAAFEIARGKPAPPPEEGAEEYYRYTYDPGPMGVEKWGRKLDIKTMGHERGRRVEASAVGEEVPRLPDRGAHGGGAVDRRGDDAGTGAKAGDAPVQVRLRFDRTHTTPHVDLSIRDQTGHEMMQGAAAAGPLGTAAAILEQAAQHDGGDLVTAEATVAQSHFAPPPSATLDSAMPKGANTDTSPRRPSTTLAPPKIRLSTNSASPGASGVSPAAPSSPAPGLIPARSPVPAPPSATPPPAPPTPVNSPNSSGPPSAGGMKIRLGGSFSNAGASAKRSAGAVSPFASADSPAAANGNGSNAYSPRTPGSAGPGTPEGGEGPDARPAKRPAVKIRLGAPVVKQEP